MKSPAIKYQFYATLLDSFRTYTNSDSIWEKYWGVTEEPPCTPEEFRQMKHQELLDRINRVPYDSEAADRGTVLNDIVDCILEHHNSKKCKITKVYIDDKVVALTGEYNGRSYTFPMSLIREIADYYEGTLPQQYVEGVLPTAYGGVKLYGYVDYVGAFTLHDLKTTSRYAVGNYRDGAQHLVYPYCLHQQGVGVEAFEYNVIELNKQNTMYSTYTELYNYHPEQDAHTLTIWCEEFIDFLERHKEFVTDKKIFNGN